MNLGLLKENIRPLDNVVGSFTAVQRRILAPDGDYSNSLPIVEYQNKSGFDRMACVTYSLLNSIEIQAIKLEGIEYNFSDRFLAKSSGTTKNGNYLSTVFDTLADKGVCLETEYPDEASDWNDYYKPLTDDLNKKATKFLDKYEVTREWVPPYSPELIYESLKEAPLQATVKWASGDDILNPDGEHNHAIIIFNSNKGKYWEIFDHYWQTRKKYAWYYEFGAVLKPILTLKDNYKYMIFKQNQLYLLVEGNEQKLGMYLDGSMIIDSKIDLLLNSASRSGKFTPPIPVLAKDWNNVPHKNLKGEQI